MVVFHLHHANRISERPAVKRPRGWTGFQLPHHRKQNPYLFHHAARHLRDQPKKRLPNLMQAGIFAAMHRGHFLRHPVQLSRELPAG
jgi:hypothetical protein